MWTHSGCGAELSHPECSYFGANRSRYVDAALRRRLQLSSLTEQVNSMRQAAARDASPPVSPQNYADGSIDSYIFADLRANNIAPAPKTTDLEFMRRASLD